MRIYLFDIPLYNYNMPPKRIYTNEELRERIRARDRRRNNDPERVAARKAYQLTPKGIEAGNRAKDTYILRNKEKRFAHNVLNAALRDKKILKSDVCHRCHLPGELEAHHPDYSNPLAVLWVHDACHKTIHKEQRCL